MRRPGWAPTVDGFDDDDVGEQGLVAALDTDAAEAASPDALVDSLELPGVPTDAPPPPPEPPGTDGPPPMPAPAPRYFDDIAAERDDIAKGAEQDRMARMIRGIEMGSKQLTAGVLQQPMAQLVSPESTNYQGIAQARADKGEAKRFQWSQGEIAAAHKRAMLERQGKLDEAKAAKDKAEAERQAKLDELKQRKDESDADFRERQLKSQEARAAAHNQAMIDAAATGKTLPAGEVKDLGDIDTAIGALDGLLENFNTTTSGGLGGRANALATDTLGLQGTDTALYYASKRPVQQAVGTILEGGKLAAGDERKYDNMFPKPGDSPEVARKKVDDLKSILARVKSGRMKSFGGAGYKTPQSATGKITVTNGKETLQIDPADEEAAAADGFKRVPK